MGCFRTLYFVLFSG